MSSDMIKTNDATFCEGARWKACALAAVLLLSGAALAGSRAAAKRHFRDGLALPAPATAEDEPAPPGAAVSPAYPGDGLVGPETFPPKPRPPAREISQQLSAGHSSADEEMFDEQVVSASARSISEIRAPASLTV